MYAFSNQATNLLLVLGWLLDHAIVLELLEHGLHHGQ